MNKKSNIVALDDIKNAIYFSFLEVDYSICVLSKRRKSGERKDIRTSSPKYLSYGEFCSSSVVLFHSSRSITNITCIF